MDSSLKGAVFSIALMITGTSPASADGVPRLSKDQCKAFFREIKLKRRDDLALVPFVQKSLTEIYATVSYPGLTNEQLLKGIVAVDTRGFAFQIEGIGLALMSVSPRRYREIFSEGQLLENAIGDYTFATEMMDFIHKPEFAPLLTPKIEAYFQGRVNEAGKTVVQTIRRRGWSGDGEVYRTILTNLTGKHKIVEEAYLKKHLLEWMSDEFEKIHKRIVNGKLDPKNIEFGIHKLRRDIRKVAIAVLSFDGMFFLDDTLKIPGITLSDASRNATKFLPSTENMLENPAGISREGFLFIGQTMGELGKLKGNDGMREYLFKQLSESGLGPEIQPLMEVVNPEGVSAASFAATRASARKIFSSLVGGDKEIPGTNFFLQMAKQFRKAAKRVNE